MRVLAWAWMLTEGATVRGGSVWPIYARRALRCRTKTEAYLSFPRGPALVRAPTRTLAQEAVPTRQLMQQAVQEEEPMRLPGQGQGQGQGQVRAQVQVQVQVQACTLAQQVMRSSVLMTGGRAMGSLLTCAHAQMSTWTLGRTLGRMLGRIVFRRTLGRTLWRASLHLPLRLREKL